jgi:tripartite-type tricarboxylate transporter receptor subunit TctC
VSLNNLKVSHIPLKGSVEIAASLIRGDTQFAFPIAGTGVPLVKGGKFRALAVTSKNRLAQFPDVPTIHDSGLSGFEFNSWFAMMAPSNTPKPMKLKTTVQTTASL